MQDVYESIEEYNPNKKIINNEKLSPVVTELFIRGRKLNISIAFITQVHFKVL